LNKEINIHNKVHVYALVSYENLQNPCKEICSDLGKIEILEMTTVDVSTIDFTHLFFLKSMLKEFVRRKMRIFKLVTTSSLVARFLNRNKFRHELSIKVHCGLKML